MPISYTARLIYRLKIVPRWVIFALDLFLTAFSFFISFLLLHDLNFHELVAGLFLPSLALLLLVNAVVFLSLGTYRGIVRYTGMKDSFLQFSAVFLFTFILQVVEWISQDSFQHTPFTKPLLILYGTFSFLFLLGYRVLVKQIFASVKNFRRKKKNVFIFGAGDKGLAAKRVIGNDTFSSFDVVGFVDNDQNKLNKLLDGVPVMDVERFRSYVETGQVDELIIANVAIPSDLKNVLVDICLDQGIKVLVVPPYSQWSDGRFATRQLRNIRIEDLLERDPIVLENDTIKKQVKGKRILVTGAAGSIGSELVRQLLTYEPELLILCDQAETPLHHLELELRESGYTGHFEVYLANISHRPRMEALFSRFRPQLVYHAAAYKHVPMMEVNPVEAIKVNVLGTRILTDLAINYSVECFVMISTDKAVNPTNVMGASKRLAEMYVQARSLDYSDKIRFITTRFGNVLGSNGSVVLRFKEQIEKGGPVTVTDPNITRYFMTIPEACQLVLEAGSMGNGGEIFVFDMGKPVKIVDLAMKMIRLYGMLPQEDISIQYTGIRKGEKLFEELLTDGENSIKTYHEKIMIAKVKTVNPDYVNDCLDLLYELIENSADETLLVAKLKQLIPEFKSNNSIFESLDLVQQNSNPSDSEDEIIEK